MTEPSQFLAERFCQTLLHSVWQLAVLTVGIVIIGKIARRMSVHTAYALHVTALMAGLGLIPTTFIWLSATGVGSGVHRAVPPIAEVAADNLVTPASSRSHVEHGAIARADRAITQVPASAAQRSASFRWTRWALFAYFGGALCMLVRLGSGTIKSWRLKRSARLVESGPAYEALRALAKNSGLRRAPRLMLSESAIVPGVVGLTKPILMMPLSVVSGLAPDQLDLVLTHELTHVKRRDMWIVLVQRWAEVLLFFNPGLWYLTRRIDTIREHCCDESTCQLRGVRDASSRLRYAETLLRIAELAGASGGLRLAPAHLSALGDRPSELRTRIARLLESPHVEASPASSSIAAILLVAIAMAFVSQLFVPETARATEKTPPDAATLSFANGGRVELIALGQGDGAKRTWWNAEGERIEVPFEWQDGRGTDGKVDGWHRLVIRLADLSEDAESTWRIVDTNSWGARIAMNGDHPRGYFARHFQTYDEDQRLVNVRVGLAQGDWKPVAATDGRGYGVHGRSDNHSVAISSLVDTDEGAFIVATHTFFEENFRVVAFDHEGKMHDTAGRGGSSSGGLYLTQALFRQLHKDQIARIEFQIRPYEWVEFKDLPLASH